MTADQAAQHSLDQTEQAQLLNGIAWVKQSLTKQLATESGISPVSLIRQMHRQLDLLSEHAQCAGNFACKSQCSSCCHKEKHLSLIELNYITEQLLHHYPEKIQAWRKKIDLALASKETRCPFLSPQQNCEIYSLRPAVCRKAHSYSASACLSNQQSIPQHLGLIMQAEALILGTQLAIQANQEADNPTMEFISGIQSRLSANRDIPQAAANQT